MDGPEQYWRKALEGGHEGRSFLRQPVRHVFVRAPENELNHGADMTLGTPPMEDRFSEAYARAFEVPLLDHNFYRNLLLKNFHPYSYAQLAAEYPCIVVRTSLELNAKTSNGLLELKPDHCPLEGIQIYTEALLARKSGARCKMDENVSRDAAGKG